MVKGFPISLSNLYWFVDHPDAAAYPAGKKGYQEMTHGTQITKSAGMLWIALYILLSGFAQTEASTIRKGQVGFRFLENPVSAEALGRGGLGVVTLRNVNTVYWNPAGLGWVLGKVDFAANYTKGIADINHSALAGAVRLGGFGFLAVDALIMDYGELQGTRRAGNSQGFVDTEVFTPQAYALGLSFSQQISNRFSYGIRVKYARQDLGTAYIGTGGTDVDDPDFEYGSRRYSLSEPAIDVGTIYDFQSYGLRFGASMQNISREIRYEEEKFPLPYAVSFSLTAAPLAFLVGNPETTDLLVGFETRHPRDFRERVKFGAEYTLHELLILRSGYLMNYDERGFTFGLGIRPEYGKSRIRIDYAFQEFGLFGITHLISFGVSR